MFRSRNKLNNFWTAIFQTLSETFGRDIQPSAEMATFEVPGESISKTNTIKNVLAFSTLLARRRILLEWKSEHPPKASTWIKDLTLFLQLEKIKYCIRGSTQTLHDTWARLLSHLEKLKVLQQN